MRIIDCTLAIPEEQNGRPTIKNYGVTVPSGSRTYHAICHTIEMDGMSGTYLDFPGHIRETDDGHDAGSVEMEQFYLLETTVIRLNRQGRPPEITRLELEQTGTPVRGSALIIHALGEQNFLDFPKEADMPYFGESTFDWITATGIRLFASDVYEKQGDARGIFPALFRVGIAAVCHPVHLSAVPAPYTHCCAIFNRHPGAVQIPCRFFVVEP